MAKKSKDDAPNPNSVANRDILQRLNFLYQASIYLDSIQPRTEAAPVKHRYSSWYKRPSKRERRAEEWKERKGKRRVVGASDLGRAYVKDMRLVSQKATVRMDPTIKRTLCKGCNTVLVPGSTARVRVNTSSSHGQAVSYTCITCKTTRTIPAPPTLDATDPDPAPGSSAAGPSHLSAPPAPTAGPSHTSALPEASDADVSMQQPTPAPNPVRPGRRRRRPQPRAPPLFERDAGHIVFRGNEILVDDAH